MKLRTLLPLFLASSVAVSAGTVWLAIELMGTLERVAEAQDRRFQSSFLADELRHSSDDLTRFARMFVETGEERFEEYFRQVLAIRNGEAARPDGYEGIYWDRVIAEKYVPLESATGEAISLRDRMVALGFTETEFTLLAEAHRRSDNLTAIETRAFNAVRGLFEDDEGSYTLVGPPDRTLAQSLLFGEEYLRAKASIMEPIGRFQEHVNSRTAAALVALRNDARILLLGVFVAAGGLLGLLLVLSVLIHRRALLRSAALAEAAEQIAAGELDVRSGVRGKDELGVLGATFDNMVSRLAETLELVTAAKERMEEELNVAREIQRSMIPLTFPAFPDRPEFSVHALLVPAREVGGDFYDFFFVDDERLCVCIGDVAGKGVPSALFMAVTRTLINSTTKSKAAPGQVITDVNETLCENNDTAMFVTIFLGILNVRSGEFTYTNAGHNPPYLARAEGELLRLDQLHGPVVGAMEGLTYGEDRLCLHPGDSLLLYTDGVTEAMNEQKELFTEKRLKQRLSSGPVDDAEKTVKNVLHAVKTFEGEAEQADDITLMVLRFLGPTDP